MTHLSSFSNLSRALCLASYCAVAPVAFVAVPTLVQASQETELRNAIALHDKGRAGDSAAVVLAVSAFEELIKSDSQNPHALAYLGSSYALTARDSRSVIDKVRYTNRGLRYLDAAASLAPQDFTVRVIRANVAVNLPNMFGRRNAAIEDMLVLDSMFAKVQSPQMAGAMIGVYSHLKVLSPDSADWDAKLASARATAGN